MANLEKSKGSSDNILKQYVFRTGVELSLLLISNNEWRNDGRIEMDGSINNRMKAF